MSAPPMSKTTHHGLVSFLSLLAIVVSIGGCRSSKQATADEGFFQPLKSVERSAAPKPSKVANAQKPSASDKLADSLTERQREQGRRIGALTGQLQILETSRKSDKPDSSKARGAQPDKASRPAVQPAPGKYEEFLRQYEAGQYKAAADGFRGLLQSGVPKDVEDQYHYMIGMSNFKLRQFDQAAASLKTVANWKGSKLRAEAYFVLGQTYKQLGASRQAKSMFQSVLKESPKADLARAARNELKGLAAKK
jgi:TolA-binding protein